MSYKPLSPKQLISLGFSEKSKRFINTDTGETISKRQYQKLRSIGQYRGREATPPGVRSRRISSPLPSPKSKLGSLIAAGRAFAKGMRASGWSDAEIREVKKERARIKQLTGLERSESIAKLFERTPKDYWDILRALLGSP